MCRSVLVAIGLVIGSSLAAACGGSAMPPALIAQTVSSDLRRFSIQVASDPNPAIRGVNKIEYTLSSTSSSLDGLTLTVVPWMPSHGHGTSVKPTIQDLGGGKFEIDDVLFFMPGTWELRTTIEPTGDHAAPSFEIQ